MTKKVLLLVLLFLISSIIPSNAQIYYRRNQPQNRPQYNKQYGSNQYNNYQYNQFQPNGNNIEMQMNYQDQMMINKMAATHPVDNRYDQFLNVISTKFNNVGRYVFPNYDSKDSKYVVMPGVFGYNAVSFHRSIVIDSLLLEVDKRLAMGMAYYGKIDTPYTRQLAMAAVRATQMTQNGTLRINTNNPYNPYNLPEIQGQLSPSQQKLAELYFEHLVAAILAHEGSHVFREHTKQKMLTQQKLWQQGQGNMNQIQQYINTNFTKEKEYEADLYGLKLLKRAGYSREGMVAWFRFADIFESITGTLNLPNRDHPTGAERINQVNRAWNSL